MHRREGQPARKHGPLCSVCSKGNFQFHCALNRHIEIWNSYLGNSHKSDFHRFSYLRKLHFDLWFLPFAVNDFNLLIWKDFVFEVFHLLCFLNDTTLVWPQTDIPGLLAVVLSTSAAVVTETSDCFGNCIIVIPANIWFSAQCGAQDDTKQHNEDFSNNQSPSAVVIKENNQLEISLLI